MRVSQLYAPTLRETPAEAEVISHQLMLRAGMIRRATGGIYTYMPLALRTLRKIETIVREEMDAKGGQELLMPIMQPAEMWQETGRWDGGLVDVRRDVGVVLPGSPHRISTPYCSWDAGFSPPAWLISSTVVQGPTRPRNRRMPCSCRARSTSARRAYPVMRFRSSKVSTPLDGPFMEEAPVYRLQPAATSEKYTSSLLGNSGKSSHATSVQPLK